MSDCLEVCTKSNGCSETIDTHFGFSRYAERLGRSANSFDELYQHLQKESTYIDKITLKILNERIEKVQPKLICFSVPFPGNLYSAFRSAQFIKKYFPEVKISFSYSSIIIRKPSSYQAMYLPCFLF